MRTAKNYFNASRLDYSESKQADCKKCGRVFRDERIVWGGRPLTDFRGMCESCSKISLLPRIPLLTTAPQTQVSLKCDVRMTEEEAVGAMAKNYGNLTALYCLAANGDKRALPILLELGFLMTHFLEMFAKCQPEKLRPYAHHALSWPMFAGPKSGKTNDVLLRQIELGHNLSIGKWNLRAPSTCAARIMWNWLGQNRSDLKLPPFDRKTAKQWFDQGWAALLYATEGKPEKDNFLRGIGKHRERHSENGKVPQQEKFTPATGEANIRDGIKKQLWQSFKNFIPKSP